jgi:hypothetical protein
MADRVAYTQPQAGLTGESGMFKRFGCSALALATTDLVLNRTVDLFKVPKGFVLTSISVTVSDMDTNGSPTLAFTLGDSGSAARILAAATTAQAGGTTTTLAAAGTRYEFTDETTIMWTTSTASATAAAGTITVDLFGYIR